MRTFGYRIAPAIFGSVLILAASSTQAQTTPGGAVLSPTSHGSHANTAGCSTTDAPSTATSATDVNCAESAPRFAAPLLDTPTTETPRTVTALVRVSSAMPRPPVVLPAGNSFTVVGDVTVIKVRRADQAACLATGKRISARVNAATSTTCLDHKGDLIAIEECRSGSPDCTVLTAQDIAGQQAAAAKP